jgi:glycosyltransferase involved in cell wall biosynthesis
LAVGGIEARKNTVRLLQAFVQFRLSAPQAQLVIAGGTSLLDHGAYRAQFGAAAQAAGVEIGRGKALVLTGQVPDEDMPALYRVADALVFPSVKEGFGLVVLEAMACATPAVVSRIAPFTEHLGEGDCVWVDPLSVESIAAAISTACMPAKANVLRAAGRAVCERFTWAASAQRHLEIYRHSVHNPAEVLHA